MEKKKRTTAVLKFLYFFILWELVVVINYSILKSKYLSFDLSRMDSPSLQQYFFKDQRSKIEFINPEKSTCKPPFCMKFENFCKSKKEEKMIGSKKKRRKT